MFVLEKYFRSQSETAVSVHVVQSGLMLRNNYPCFFCNAPDLTLNNEVSPTKILFYY
jgi:hypothetical protein